MRTDIKDKKINVKQYLERINYVGELYPTPEVLSNLQLTHLMNVPFENLDIHNKIRINLSNSFNKIVLQKRGGFCYELNSLFFELLKEIGFSVKIISARVYDYKNGYGPEFDHMATIATINKDDYLADVGFGEFSFYPIKIEINKEHKDPRGVFKIEPYNEKYKVVKKKNNENDFIPEYIFSEEERQIEDFNEMCNYHQTSCKSHFTQKRICSLPTNEGRITLKGNTLMITAKESITEKELKTEPEVLQVLWDYFKIKI